MAVELDDQDVPPRVRLDPSWRERLRDWVESFDLTPRQLLIGLALIAVAGVGGWHLLAPDPLPPEMSLPVASASGPEEGATGSTVVDATTTSTAQEEVVVHVAGAVRQPGVVQLDRGARLVDAVDAAGGATDDADLAQINLAAVAEDGQQIYVPRLGEAPPPPPAGAAGTEATGAGDGDGDGSESVNINTADLDELDTLPGIGPVLAQAIIDHREQHGEYTSVEQLLDVRGIGEVTLEDLRDLVTV